MLIRQRFFTRAAWTIALSAILMAGCQGRQIFQANRLPPELAAPRVGSAHRMDLSRIARSIGNSEILNPGDLVRVTITTGVEESVPEGWELRIGNNGVCGIPLVGPVHLSGLGIAQAEDVIRQESIRRQKFVNPNVALVLKKPRSHRVTIAGAVVKPGTYEVPSSQADLLGALMAAGGIADDAGTVIEIRHPPGGSNLVAGGAGHAAQLAGYPGEQAQPLGPQILHVDLEQAVSQPDGDYRVFDGTTVMVMPKPERFVHVIGLVNQADQFEIPDDSELRLLDAIAMAGGLRLEIADKVHVMREVPNRQELVVIEASIRKAKSDGVSNIRLAAGDVISVEETPTTFVIGTIRDFVRFGFTSGIPGI